MAKSRSRPRGIRPKKKIISISFEVPVLEYLEKLSDQEERNRSQLINRLVRDYAARNGSPIYPVPKQMKSTTPESNTD